MFTTGRIFPSSRLRKPVALFSLIFCFLTAFSDRTLAQTEPLKVKYNFNIDDGDRVGAKLEIERDGKRWKSKDGGDVKGSIDLDYQHEYIMKFSRPGFITKMIAVSTKVPKDMVKDGFEPLLFDVTIFKQYDGVNIVVFNQPVAKYDYQADKDDFGYDTDYTKTILSEVKKAEDELKLKHKEDKNFADKANVRATQANKPPDNEVAGKKGKEGDPGNEDGTKKGAREGDPVNEDGTKKTAKEGTGTGQKKGVVNTENNPRQGLNSKTDESGRNGIKARTDAGGRGGVNARTEGSDPRNKNLSSRAEGEGRTNDAASMMNDNHIEREYVEGNRHITETTVVRNGRTFVYKKVAYVWGVYYFRDGTPITQPSYIQEAL